MCGIFGYIGKKNNAPQIVLKGLKTLEYRGYDSWGIAIKENSKLKTRMSKLEAEKHIGKIAETNINLGFFSTKSNLAIGHTRWATHGGVTKENAHPHFDCNKQIALIHNGIVENYNEIKDKLIKKGHKLLSETDTEVIVHLIEENLKKEGFATSVRMAFNQLNGLNAIVVMNTQSAEIIGAKNGSPLAIGKNQDELLIASDASGIIPYTNRLLFLKDNEMVILGKDIQLISLPTGKKIKTKFEEIDWKIEEAEKGKYAHFMLKEIHEQAKVIRNIAKNYDNQILTFTHEIKKSRGTFFIAAGTAYHAGLSGVYLFSKLAKRHVNTAIASEFNYLEDFLNQKSLVIALSQSGETIDVVEPLARAKAKGAKIGSITNSLGSTIYRMSDQKMLLAAGPEKAVASTKAYTAKLSILFLLAEALAGNLTEGKKLIEKVALEIERILTPAYINKIKQLAKILSKKEHIYVIGRGASFPSALEAALKIKEVSYIHTEGLAGGELKHGTIALIENGTPCLVFAPEDKTFSAIISNAIEIKARGGVIIGISSKKHEVFDYFLEIKNLEDATIIPQIVPAQLLGYYLALEKKLDPDKPRNLAKSVTVK